MPQRPVDLPDFASPPVHEVAIACHFEPLTDLRQAHIGYFWSKIKDDFPDVEDHEPRPPYVERLEDGIQIPAFELELMRAPMPHRAWFVSPDKSALLQLQRDRFVYNWRSRSDEYPHFELLLDAFLEELKTLCNAFNEINLSEPHLNQAEVTYVNWIDADALDLFLAFVDSPSLNTGGVASDGAFGQISLRFPVMNDSNVVGHLYTECSPIPALGEQGSGYQMTLTFRAPMLEPHVDVLKPLLLRGRAAIVHTFAGLTRPSYHEKWGRIQ